MKKIIRKIPSGVSLVILIINNDGKEEKIELARSDKNYWHAFYGQIGDEVEYSLDKNGNVVDFNNLSFEEDGSKNHKNHKL